MFEKEERNNQINLSNREVLNLASNRYWRRKRNRIFTWILGISMAVTLVSLLALCIEDITSGSQGIYEDSSGNAIRITSSEVYLNNYEMTRTKDSYIITDYIAMVIIFAISICISFPGIIYAGYKTNRLNKKIIDTWKTPCSLENK